MQRKLLGNSAGKGGKVVNHIILRIASYDFEALSFGKIVVVQSFPVVADEVVDKPSASTRHSSLTKDLQLIESSVNYQRFDYKWVFVSQMARGNAT